VEELRALQKQKKEERRSATQLTCIKKTADAQKGAKSKRFPFLARRAKVTASDIKIRLATRDDISRETN